MKRGGGEVFRGIKNKKESRGLGSKHSETDGYGYISSRIRRAVLSKMQSKSISQIRAEAFNHAQTGYLSQSPGDRYSPQTEGMSHISEDDQPHTKYRHTYQTTEIILRKPHRDKHSQKEAYSHSTAK